MICPECKYNELVLLQGGSTLMNFPYFEDENKKWHHHDENIGSRTYQCMSCKHKFTIPFYNICWCGWTNQYPILSKTHKEEHNEPFKGFKLCEPVITNNEWIVNLVYKPAQGKHDFPTSNKSTEYPE